MTSTSPREDVAERRRQRGGLRQDRVPDAVPQKDRGAAKPFRFREEDVVFPLCRDHHAPHAERPAARRDQHDGKRRQDCVADHVANEGERQSRESAGTVAAEHREQLDPEREDVHQNQAEKEKRNRMERPEKRHEDAHPPR